MACRFHTNNGAAVARINWMADEGCKALVDTFGMMVNYMYLDQRTDNQLSYVMLEASHRKREQLTVALVDSLPIMRTFAADPTLYVSGAVCVSKDVAYLCARNDSSSRSLVSSL